MDNLDPKRYSKDLSQCLSQKKLFYTHECYISKHKKLLSKCSLTLAQKNSLMMKNNRSEKWMFQLTWEEYMSSRMVSMDTMTPICSRKTMEIMEACRLSWFIKSTFPRLINKARLVYEFGHYLKRDHNGAPLEPILMICDIRH